MSDLIISRVKLSDHFLRRWKDRVENVDVEEQAEAHFGKPRHKISDSEWITFVRGRGFDTTMWKCAIARDIGAAPANGEMIVGVWRVVMRNGVAVTVKHTSEAR